MTRTAPIAALALTAALLFAPAAGAASAPRCAHNGSSLVGQPTIADTPAGHVAGARIVASARHKRRRHHHRAPHHRKPPACLPASRG